MLKVHGQQMCKTTVSEHWCVGVSNHRVAAACIIFIQDEQKKQGDL